MPVTKRGTKVVSYNEEEDDDDDFVSVTKQAKKSRPEKSDAKPRTKTREEKKPTFDSEEPVLVLEPVKVATTVTDSPAIAPKEESRSAVEHSTDEEDQDEPQTKRIKYVEEDEIKENESDKESDVNVSPEEKPVDETEESPTKSGTLSFDLTATRTSAARTADLPARRSSAPLGFPTSKINISSPHVSRVGLSRKSATLKPLHPNFTSRVVPE